MHPALRVTSTMVEIVQYMRGSVEREILTNFQLKEIEREVDKIIALTAPLNPDNPDDAEILYHEDAKLDQYLRILKKSYRNLKIKKSGLQLIG